MTTHLWTALTKASFFSACSTSVESSQIVATESAPADTIVFSSDETAKAQIWGVRLVLHSPQDLLTLSSWLSRVLTHSSSLTFHSLTRPSEADVTSCIPWERKSTRSTEFV
jgi:hypothetical protein